MNPSRWRAARAALLVFVCAAAASWILLLRPSDDAAIRALPSFSYDFGKGRVFEVEVKSEMSYSSSPAMKSDEGEARVDIVQEVRGELAVRRVGSDSSAGGAVLAMQLRPASMRYVSNGVERKIDDSVNAYLGHMFLAAFDGRGAVRSFDFPPDTPDVFSSILEGIVRSIQLVLPKDESAVDKNGAWKSLETDANGDCLVSYSPIPAGSSGSPNPPQNSGGAARKTRLAYSAPVGGETPLHASILSSDVTMSFDGAWITGAEGKERMDFRSPSGQRMGMAAVGVRMKEIPSPTDKTAAIWRETRTAREIGSWFAARRNAVSALERVEQSARERALADGGNEAGKITDKARIMIELANYLTLQMTAEPSLRNKFTEYLKANPEAAAIVGEIMPNMDDSVAQYAVLALQSAGTPACQAALCAIMTGERQSRMNRLRATAAFSFVESPTPKSLDTLRSVTDNAAEDQERRSAALLALGGAAGNMKDEPELSEAYNRAVLDLRQRLGSAKASVEPGAERTALLAIGNMQDERMLDDVAPYLDADDPVMRRTAAGLLGGMPGDRTCAVIVKTLDAESDEKVRQAAAKSLEEQPFSKDTVDYAIRAIGIERDPSVEAGLAHYLAKSARHSAKARQTLEGLWETTPNREVLRVIRDMRRQKNTR